jgi:CRISPR-associated protein Csd2
VTTTLTKIYYDVRAFGAVATTGDSCGAVRGPWQIGQGTSHDPLDDPTQAITRDAITRVEDKDVKRQEMGRRNPTPYALYRFHGFYSPTSAFRTGWSVQDMKLFWSAAVNFGVEQQSSLRGHIGLAGIYVFAHDHPMGAAHAHELFDRISIVRDPHVIAARRFSDYRVIVDDLDLPRGIDLVRLYARPRRTVPNAADAFAADPRTETALA